MAKFNTDTLSLFHTFSKTQVNSDANKPQFSSLGNTVNKSGHTVQSNEIWTEAIPFFGLGVPADFSSTAQVNDLVKDADGVIWQRNATPYTDANGTYWTQKTKSITSFTKGADGKYTFTEEDGALVDGSYLLNAAGVPTVKYHAKKQLTPLVSDNNAFIDSEKDASRLKIDGKWVDQFIGVTDVYVNGSAAVSYAPVLFATSSDTSPLKAGAGEDYLDYCATGIILWDKNDCTGNEVISCFEYVGAKLDATVAKLSAAVFGSGSTGDEDLSLSEQVTANTTALNVLKGSDEVDGSIAKSIKTAIENLGDVAVKSDITITEIKVKSGSTTTTLTPDSNKSVTVEIPEVQAATTSVAGVVTISDNDAIAITETSTAAATVAAVAATRSAIAGEMGALAGTVEDAMEEAQAKVASVTLGTVPGGISLGDDTKNPVLTIETCAAGLAEGTNKLITAGGAHAIATHYADLAEGAAVDTVKAISLDSLASSTQGSYVSVTTSGSIGSGLSVSVDDSALASTVSAAASAVQTVKVNGSALTKDGSNAVDITAIVGVNESAINGIKVITTGDNKVQVAVEHADYDADTKEFTTASAGYFVTAADVTTAISDAVGAITIPSVTTSSAAQTVGVTASGHEVSVATATYTASTDTWANQGYLVTGATVEAFVNDVVSEVSSDLTALENKVNAYHEAGVSYKVHDSQTLPDLSIEANVEKYKNVILLVPTDNDSVYDLDDTEAMSGGYIEYLCVKTGETTYAWEKIGTTEADLEGYVRAIQPNNKVGSSEKSSPVYASISSEGYLTLGIDSATSEQLGVSKMFSGNYWELPSTATDTAVSTLTASQMFTNIGHKLNDKADATNVVNSINGKRGDVTLCVHNYCGQDAIEEGDIAEGNTIVSNHANLWGMSFIAGEWDDNVILVDDFVGMSGSYLTTANLPSSAVSVENNFVIRANGDVISSIRPERMVSGFDAQPATGLKSFVGDLSNLETSNLSDGTSTFYHCSALETFIGDLSSLRNGSGMFEGCVSLTSFIGDLSSLEFGTKSMSSGNDGGYGMFGNTNLTVESVENIADALPENPAVDTNRYKGCIGISWRHLTSDTAERQELVDALSGVVDKGWVLVTNTELLTMFDTEKYQVVNDTIQPLDLDGEPQQIAYVIKK